MNTKERSSFFKGILNLIRGITVGALTGLVIFLFATAIIQSDHLNRRLPLLFLFLPLGAVVLALIYGKIDKKYKDSTTCAIDEIHFRANIKNENLGSYQRSSNVTPLSGVIGFFTASFSHILGASVGKEGVGVQIGISVGSLLERIENKIRGLLNREDSEATNYYLMSGASAAFGALFGSPVAGILFGTQFASPTVTRIDAFLPCTVASYTAVFIARALNTPCLKIPSYIALPFTFQNTLIVALFAILIGFAAKLYCISLEKFKIGVRKLFHKTKYGSVIAPALIAMVIIGINYIINRDLTYNGLSEELLYRSITGSVDLYSFLIKALLVFLCIAAGFIGGEVVPLLVIGSTLGFTIATLLSLDTASFAVLGAICLLSGGTNLPLVAFALGLELFHFGDLWLIFLASALAYVTSGSESIYQHQLKVIQ